MQPGKFLATPHRPIAGHNVAKDDGLAVHFANKLALPVEFTGPCDSGNAPSLGLSQGGPAWRRAVARV
jgi:hypothetical protein